MGIVSNNRRFGYVNGEKMLCIDIKYSFRIISKYWIVKKYISSFIVKIKLNLWFINFIFYYIIKGYVFKW